LTPSCIFAAGIGTFDRIIYEPAASIETTVKGSSFLPQVARKQNIRALPAHFDRRSLWRHDPANSPMKKHPIHRGIPISASKASADLLVQAYVRTYGIPRADHALVESLRARIQFPETFSAA